MFAGQRASRGQDISKFIGVELVGFGQDDLIGDGGSVEHCHDRLIDGFDAVAAIDQQKDAGKILAALQVVLNEAGPGIDFVFGRFSKAIAGHVYEVHVAIVGAKVVELLRAARRV